MTAESEIVAGERFAFGDNWRRFLDHLTVDQIERSISGLQDMVGDVTEVSFLDVGCGSGLSSLAAIRLGADVTSFDFDPQSVACTRELRRRCAPDADWRIEQGSALDRDYLASLGTFDLVYSWGVLHHTGAMWDAIDRVTATVAPGGRLALAIYNYVPGWTERWIAVKRRYNESGRSVRAALLTWSLARLWGPTVVRDTIRRRRPWATWRSYGANSRGMSPWHDLVDWVGGWPYEAATPEQVETFLHERGFSGGLTLFRAGNACSEFVFIKEP